MRRTSSKISFGPNLARLRDFSASSFLIRGTGALCESHGGKRKSPDEVVVERSRCLTATARDFEHPVFVQHGGLEGHLPRDSRAHGVTVPSNDPPLHWEHRLATHAHATQQ